MEKRAIYKSQGGTEEIETIKQICLSHPAE